MHSWCRTYSSLSLTQQNPTANIPLAGGCTSRIDAHRSYVHPRYVRVEAFRLREKDPSPLLLPNAVEIKPVIRKDTSCRSGRNCCVSYRVPRGESERKETCMHIKCGGKDTAAVAGGESCACQKLCLYRRIKNVTKTRAGGETAGASRKFKVTKRYGGITRNRNAETNGGARFYSATETDIRRGEGGGGRASSLYTARSFLRSANSSSAPESFSPRQECLGYR